MARKIYIDITQLYNWQGKVTGIQRVMDELSRRFLTDTAFEPIYIVWQKHIASFREVSFSDTPQEKERRHTPAAPATARSHTSSTTAQTTKKLLRTIYYHAPLSRTVYNAYSSITGRLVAKLTPQSVIEIDDNSLLFMPHGGVWESETYITTILDLQRHHNVKLVPILFDTVPVTVPQFAVEAITIVFGNYMRQVLPRADLVLAISENTARDAQAWLASTGQQPINNVQVFRLGDEVGERHTAALHVPKEFILCVGTIEVRKNHTALYYAYKLALQEGRKLPPVVIVGRVGWMAGDIYALSQADPETKEAFIFLHTVSDEQLAWLYKQALFSIYPSFYEGWGLPIAESLLWGTPCLASETSSMKEIGGKLVDYFSPFSTSQIKDQLLRYYNDRELLARKKQQIQAGYLPTTWDMSYAQVATAIRQL